MKLILFILFIIAAVPTFAEHACEPIAKQMPTCAQECVDKKVLDTIGCSSTSDYDCMCAEGRGAQMDELVKGCVMKKCGLWTAQSVSAKALEICDCVRAQGSRDEL